MTSSIALFESHLQALIKIKSISSEEWSQAFDDVMQDTNKLYKENLSLGELKEKIDAVYHNKSIDENQRFSLLYAVALGIKRVRPETSSQELFELINSKLDKRLASSQIPIARPRSLSVTQRFEQALKIQEQASSHRLATLTSARSSELKDIKQKKLVTQSVEKNKNVQQRIASSLTELEKQVISDREKGELRKVFKQRIVPILQEIDRTMELILEKQNNTNDVKLPGDLTEDEAQELLFYYYATLDCWKLMLMESEGYLGALKKDLQHLNGLDESLDQIAQVGQQGKGDLPPPLNMDDVEFSNALKTEEEFKYLRLTAVSLNYSAKISNDKLALLLGIMIQEVQKPLAESHRRQRSLIQQRNFLLGFESYMDLSDLKKLPQSTREWRRGV